ncbi:MAG TPA: ABC transporter ATP-binding protein [Clostridiales bacterium]|nr:ABC transporter ATP-binding protein [Clostridiales bacterium]
MIEVQNLTKRYGNHLAVSDLSFTIKPGKVYGLLGPNGAGKTTTMNIITGCLAASEGTVTVNGFDIFEQPKEAKSCIGYLPESPPLYQDMIVKDYLSFIAGAKGVAKEKREEQIAYAARVTGVDDVMERLIHNLSKGYKQRVGIAQALIGEAQEVILDEPTVGLDPKQIIEIRDLISRLGHQHTVILSSHILSEVRAVCDEILILSQGKLIAADTPERLESRFAPSSQVAMTVKTTKEKASMILNGFAGVNGVTYETLVDDKLVMILDMAPGDSTVEERVAEAFAENRIPVLNMEQKKADLEAVFLELTKDDTDQSGEDGFPLPAAAEMEETVPTDEAEKEDDDADHL